MATRESTPPTGRPADAPLTRLRGNTVDVDKRRLGKVAVALIIVALATLVIVFTTAGIQKNNQINRLHHDGIRMDVTVSRCLGLMGGSGSNAAGYTCTATFTLEGRRHTEALPGTERQTVGSPLAVVVVPSDPALLTPVTTLAGEHASWKVFILPAVLLIVLALLVGAIVLRRRHLRTSSPRHTTGAVP